MYTKLFGGLVHRDFGLKVIFNSLTLKSNERSFDTSAIWKYFVLYCISKYDPYFFVTVIVSRPEAEGWYDMTIPKGGAEIPGAQL